MQQKNLLDELLRSEDQDTREKVLTIVRQSGIRESDPVFLLMVANSTVQVLLRQAPSELKQTFNYCQQQIEQKLEGYEKAARVGIEQDIARTVDRLIEKASESKNAVTYKSLIGAGAMLLGVLMVGVMSGLAYARWGAQMDDRGLTAADVQALEWGQSQEGRYARQLLSWNEDLLGGQCQEQVEGLGVTIAMGTRKATSGYCLVWIVPPEKRTFAK